MLCMVFIDKILMNLLLWILRFIDAVFGIFKLLGGTARVTTNDNKDGTLFDLVFGSGAISGVFVSIFAVAILVCGICVITAVIKNTINLSGGERKPHSRTVGQGAGALLTTMVMGGVMITGIFFGNSVLGLVQNTFDAAGYNGIGEQIFDMAVEDGYQYDYAHPVYVYQYKYNEEGNSNSGFFLDENGEKVLDRDDKGNLKPVIGADGKFVVDYYPLITDNEKNPVIADGWKVNNGKMPENFSLDATNAKELRKVVDFDNFNFFIGYLGAIFILVALLSSCLGLVKRLYDIVMLYLALPLIMATIPLDDGAKFKQWRETVVSKIILAYGAVFAINIFLLIMPILMDIQFATLGGGLLPKIFNMKKLVKKCGKMGCKYNFCVL